MTTPKSEGVEWEREFENYLIWVPHYLKPEDAARMDAELKPFIAHQRQQAVAEFAREVVARVERMNGEPGDMGIHGGRDRLISKAAVLSILKQRGIEPDQPINSIFKE